ncbi:HAMP domain-containing sensor histidine kinase [Cohnella thailandensis]|nr:signal transduction histidine kinase [Cohnella thailandensis]
MKGNGPKETAAKFRHSLLSRYLLIVMSAILLLPIIISLSSLSYTFLGGFLKSGESSEPKYGNASQMESLWHEEAGQLRGGENERIERRLRELKERYPEASMFWVDGAGETRLVLASGEEGYPVPERWTASEAIRFMKASVNGDPFTVVAFLGEEHEGPDFMVLQMPRELFLSTEPTGSVIYYGLFVMALFFLFVMVSLLFFRRIRRRLLRLQWAMTLRGDGGLPRPIEQSKQDEIGQLEGAFNAMATHLEESREREREEESLRKQLIANLSHDLRTPLTVMNGHLHSLKRDNLSADGQEALKQLSGKVGDMASLIDNLLSYTLMTSGKYPLRLETTDVLRLVRESAAAWYPLWEKEGIEADIDLEKTGGPLEWRIDREGFKRVLDNLFQNVVRHAADGGYLGITVEGEGNGRSIAIADRGQGGLPSGKGAGIGLAIVGYLLKEMELDYRMERSETGTTVRIQPRGG